MKGSLNQEALLRHLLSRENCQDDDFIYSFLLGSRLFLSPHQLLTELHRLANEDVPELQRKSADKYCSKCRQHQLKSTDVKNQSGIKGTDFSSKKSPIEIIVTEGEETIRRKKRGRRRNQLDSESDFDLDFLHFDNPRLSRDSGILSAVLEPLEIDSANNNIGKDKAARVNMSARTNDSGYIVEEDASGNCSSCLRLLQKESCLRSKRQLLMILRDWVRNFPSDFRNKKTKWILHDVIKSCQNDNEDSSALCTEVIDCLSRRAAAQESYEQQLNDMDREFLTASKYITPKEWLHKYVLKLKKPTDVDEVAQQLCLIEMDLLKHVGAEEFLQLFSENGQEDARTNLGACVRWFNRLSRLVATLICTCRKRKHARQVITFYTRVANKCFELSNFNSSMSILTGLSFGPVTRLKKTWQKLLLPELKKLQLVFDPSNNFLNYRSAFTSRVEQLQTPISANDEKVGATHRFSIISQHSLGSATSSHHVDSGIECENELSPPGCQTARPTFQASLKHFNFDPKRMTHDGVVVPFVVILVKDVFFLNHAIRTVDESGNINCEKFRYLANILRPFEEWKKASSSHQKQDKIQDFLLNAPVSDDEDLYLLSYKRESPTNRFEKLQHKALKSEILEKKQNFDVELKCKTV